MDRKEQIKGCSGPPEGSPERGMKRVSLNSLS